MQKSIHSPLTEKNIVRGRGAAKISKQHKSLEQRKKTDIDQIWQSQIKEIAVSLRQVEMQCFKLEI